MTVTTVATVLAVLALVADALTGATLVGFLVSRVSENGHEWWTRFRQAVTPFALPAAFLVAGIAMAGSLYFSEVAHLDPCKLCWFQRICMYPLVLLLGIATFRRDLYTAKRFLLPLAAIGAAISTYHYQLERLPAQPTLSCGLGEPSCARALFDIFGFVSIPFMALAAFLLIVTLLAVGRDAEED